MNTMVEQTKAPSGVDADELLFTEVTAGPYTLRNRMAMSPLTRSRSRQPGNIPTALNACYYAQRAAAGLIITEATQVSMQGQGYAWTPGIHTREQVEGWRLVTSAVHERGGRIFLQLWHVGRVSHPALQPDGQLPVAPSPIAPSGQAFIENENGEGALVPFVRPRELQIVEMPYILKQYVHGAKNARAAGFDGVEIHAANGYLLDQFINSNSNRRTDAYGGPIENRARLLVEVLEAVGEVWGADRVGVRLSPLGTANDMRDEDPLKTFGYIAARLSDFGLAYLHVVDPRFFQNDATRPASPTPNEVMQRIRTSYRGKLIVAGGYNQLRAQECLAEGRADLVAFGRLFLANPDLPERFRRRTRLNKDDPSTYYGGGRVAIPTTPRSDKSTAKNP